MTTDTAKLHIRAVLNDLGYTTFNMSYAAFLQVIDNDDDEYAKNKYDDFKAIGRALARFDNATLTRLVCKYVDI